MTKHVSDLLPGDLIETHEGFHVIMECEPVDAMIRLHVHSLRAEEQVKRGKRNSYLLPKKYILFLESRDNNHNSKFLRFYRMGERLV